MLLIASIEYKFPFKFIHLITFCLPGLMAATGGRFARFDAVDVTTDCVSVTFNGVVCLSNNVWCYYNPSSVPSQHHML